MEKECQHCKQNFVVQRVDSVYCSRSCRQLAYMQRKKEKEQAGVSEKAISAEGTISSLPAIMDLKTVAIPKKEEKEYEVYNSALLDEIRQQIEEDRRLPALGSCIRIYEDIHSYWIGLRLRCLVECLLMFTEAKYTSVIDLMEICNAFTLLQRSVHYNHLPDEFPFTSIIRELRDKLKNLCLKAKKAEQIKFRMEMKDKMDLIIIRYTLAQFFVKEKFSQLNFE